MLFTGLSYNIYDGKKDPVSFDGGNGMGQKDTGRGGREGGIIVSVNRRN